MVSKEKYLSRKEERAEKTFDQAMMLNWDVPHDAFPQLRQDVCLRQWGQLCLLVNHWTARHFRVSIEAAFVLSLCYGHFSLSQILDLVGYTFQISPAQAEKEIRPVFEQCLHKEMFAVGPFAHLALTQPLCDPRSILTEATRGKTPAGRRYPAPIFLVAVLTDECNMKCIYCFRSSGRKSNSQLTTGEWLKIIDQAAELGLVRCFITGGEPTLHEGFLPIVSRLLHRGVYPYISTNGLNLTEQMIAQLIEAGLRRIQVSLDAPNERLFYDITGINRGFKQVINNIRRLVESGIDVMVKSVVMPVNYQHIGELVEFCVDLGVQIISFEPYGRSLFGRGSKEFIISKKQQAEILLNLQKAKEHFGKVIMIMANGLSRAGRWKRLPDDCNVCDGFISSMVIQPNGDVGPCELLPTVAALKIGNIREASLINLWHSPEADRIAVPPRAQFEDVCLTCEHFNYCRAGCRAYALLYSDNPFAPDPHCPKVVLKPNPVLV